MARTGDVFAIKTAIGDAYFQFVKTIASMGSLIRVLPGTYADGQPELASLVERETNFWVFFLVATAHKRGIIRKVANCHVAEHAKATPLFRAGIPNQSTGKVENWWLWDEEKEWKVGKITEEQRRLPIRSAWNDTALVERIESGWLPENDSR